MFIYKQDVQNLNGANIMDGLRFGCSEMIIFQLPKEDGDIQFDEASFDSMTYWIEKDLKKCSVCMWLILFIFAVAWNDYMKLSFAPSGGVSWDESSPYG